MITHQPRESGLTKQFSSRIVVLIDSAARKPRKETKFRRQRERGESIVKPGWSQSLSFDLFSDVIIGQDHQWHRGQHAGAFPVRRG
jgi:hypothetical protein